ncbi:MAG: hypothetical protein GQ564_18770 [Bacteroidales bacterium]|nr:hypothetical protein [Bacteroidales bacterium]
METFEIIAICGIIGTIIAPILAILFQKHLNYGRFNKIDNVRKQAIAGSWNGDFIQDNKFNDKQIKGTITGKFSTKGKIINGYMRIENKIHNTNPSFRIKGGFKMARFLVLDFENEKNEIVQFGKMIMEFSAKADKLTGMFISYGAETEDVIKGKVELRKE